MPNENSTASRANGIDATTRLPQEHPERQTLSQVIARLGNPQWDILLVGDGSGSGWAHAAGWAATIVDNRQNQARRFFYGACDCGSVNLAETMPYLQALTWYDVHHGREMLRQVGFLRVHILTDSQVIATWGNRAMAPTGEVPRKMPVFWAGMRELRRLGYHCQFHWAPRMTTELNWAADLMAGITRREVINALDPTYVSGADPATRAANAVGNLVFYNPETGERLDPYDINPGDQQCSSSSTEPSASTSST